MFARHSLPLSLAAAAALLVGCNDSLVDPLPKEPPPPPTLTLSPGDATIREGESIRLTVTATDPDGRLLAASSIQWSSSDQGVAELVGPGKVLGAHEGTALITASWGGASGAAVVNVRRRNPCPALARTDLSAVPCPVP